MNDFDASIILDMTGNIQNCPNIKHKCSACNHSADIINTQVQTALERCESLQKENQKLKATLLKYDEQLDICSYDFGAQNMGTSINRIIMFQEKHKDLIEKLKEIK